jgi:hypothetical protein
LPVKLTVKVQPDDEMVAVPFTIPVVVGANRMPIRGPSAGVTEKLLLVVIENGGVAETLTLIDGAPA